MDTLRISDADRETALDLLGEQYAVGRLDKDEFDERSDAVWSAKTQGDLAPVFADLPVRSPACRLARPGAGRSGAGASATEVGGRDGPARCCRWSFLLVLLTVLTQGAVRAPAGRALVRVRLAPLTRAGTGATGARRLRCSGSRFAVRGSCS